MDPVFAQVETTLTECLEKLRRGNSSVVLQGNMQERLGSMLGVKYFERQLSRAMEHPVDVSITSDGNSIVVQMSTQTSTKTNKPATVTAGRKYPPRPMNCWLLFRDKMHKEIKKSNPEYSVQKISQLCSEGWNELTEAEKDEWRAKAKMAKEEHQRMHPDYKYSPRKPGQKKKRQSRKATQAAAAAATAPMAPPDTNTAFVAATNPITVGIGNALPTDASHFADTLGLLGTYEQQPNVVSEMPFPEFNRHMDLGFEFASLYNPFTQFDDESFGFRAGADESATLPSFDEDMLDQL